MQRPFCTSRMSLYTSLAAHGHDRRVVAFGEGPTIAHLGFDPLDHSVDVSSDEADGPIQEFVLNQTLYLIFGLYLGLISEFFQCELDIRNVSFQRLESLHLSSR